MRAVFKREFKSYFASPLGYVVITALYFFLGMYFSMIYSMGYPSVSTVISAMTTVIIFSIPVITMRLMSEDRRQKVDQALLTAPVKLTSIVMGKFLAALALVGTGFLPTVIFEIIIASYVSVNFMEYIYMLFGILLLSGALIAIGMFISSLTESSVVAAIITLIVNILTLYMGQLSSLIGVEWIANAVNKMAFINVFENFSYNILSIPDIIYFVSIIVIFLFLCVRSLEKRRWS